MSEYDFDDDDFESDDEPGTEESAPLPKPARNRLRELEKEIKKLRRERDESSKALTEFRLRDVLTEKGITDARVSRYLTADGVNLSDPRAVEDWLSENGDLFGYKPRSTEENEREADSYREIDQAEADGIPVTGQSELLAKIANAESPEDLDALRAQFSHLKMT